MTASLSVTDLRERLGALGLETRGHRSELQARLRSKRCRAKWQQQQQQNASDLENVYDIASVQSSWEPSYHSYLVLDVEATCERGDKYPSTSRRRGFDYPNEIIEFPVVLLQWRPTTCKGNGHTQGEETAAAQGQNTFQENDYELYERDVFRSFVRPTWRPRLSAYCRSLTSVTQASVDAAPTFSEMLVLLMDFLRRHDLLHEGDAAARNTSRATTRQSSSGTNARHLPTTAENPIRTRLKKGVCWVTHGPYDLTHFVVKQAYISGLAGGVPFFLRGPLLDVKVAAVKLSSFTTETSSASKESLEGTKIVPRYSQMIAHAHHQEQDAAYTVSSSHKPGSDTTIVGLLRLLKLGEFQGQQHVGIDDTRNVARILRELAHLVASARATSDECGVTTLRKQLEDVALVPNCSTSASHLRRWEWMNSKTPGVVNWRLAAESSEDEAENA